MNFKIYNDLVNDINSNMFQIPKDVDLVVGIPRSGMLAASIIALNLNLPLTDIDAFMENRIYSTGLSKNQNKLTLNIDDIHKVLVVEDSSLTGTSINMAKEKLKHIKEDKQLIYLAVYVTDKSKSYVDLFFSICNPPRIFEWNYMHHSILNNACVDIDGVLCSDPSEKENDDSENYRKFIENARTKVIPSAEIGYLVTSRLEKYRKETELWLKKNGIKYNHLIMMQYSSKEERLKYGNHGEFKAKIYKQCKDATLFVESETHQAKIIALMTGKPVFCVGDSMFYDYNFANTIATNTKRNVKQVIKRILPYHLYNFLKMVLKKLVRW